MDMDPLSQRRHLKSPSDNLILYNANKKCNLKGEDKYLKPLKDRDPFIRNGVLMLIMLWCKKIDQDNIFWIVILREIILELIVQNLETIFKDKDYKMT